VHVYECEHVHVRDTNGCDSEIEMMQLRASVNLNV
jgi:hypothetical protein